MGKDVKIDGESRNETETEKQITPETEERDTMKVGKHPAIRHSRR